MSLPCSWGSTRVPPHPSPKVAGETVLGYVLSPSTMTGKDLQVCSLHSTFTASAAFKARAGVWKWSTNRNVNWSRVGSQKSSRLTHIINIGTKFPNNQESLFYYINSLNVQNNRSSLFSEWVSSKCPMYTLGRGPYISVTHSLPCQRRRVSGCL